MTWVLEKLHKGYGQSFQNKQTLFDSQTQHQRLEIIDTNLWGKVMLLDGVVQTTEKDEFIYHEMFAHIPAFIHGVPKTVLIVGGGDGGLLREVLKHKTIEKVVLVEIDEAVIDLCKEYFPNHGQNSWDDQRLEIQIQDGIDYVKNTQDKFDLILSDSTDPFGPGEVLFGEDFYSNAAKCLNERGIIVTQNGVDFLQLDELKQTYDRMAKIFKYNGFYSVNVPTYIGGSMSYAWASNYYNCQEVDFALIKEKFDIANIETKYYSPKIHAAGFALPRYVNAFLGCENND